MKNVSARPILSLSFCAFLRGGERGRGGREGIFCAGGRGTKGGGGLRGEGWVGVGVGVRGESVSLLTNPQKEFLFSAGIQTAEKVIPPLLKRIQTGGKQRNL